MTSESRPRLVLLGASNLTRGISHVVETARLMIGSPVEILACLGHGRSFGMESTVMGRSLPGILQSGIWKDLAKSRSGDLANRQAGQSPITTSPNHQIAKSPHPPFALITDIGNDIMYGESAETIAQWVEECVNRLEAIGAKIAITELPIQSIRTVKPWQYRVVKAMLFPSRRISFEQAVSRAGELHDRINSLAQRRNLTLIACDCAWYGFDPIHIRMKHWPAAWGGFIRSCIGCEERSSHRATFSLRRWIYLHTRTPEQWRWLGIKRGRTQPSGRLKDGTTISLY